MSTTPEAPSQVDDENAKFWLDEIDASKQRLAKWLEKAEEANKRYKDNQKRAFGALNILWANVETQKAALGEDFGKPDVTRANIPDDDGLTRYVSLLWQRCIDAAVGDTNDNHEIKNAVHDVLLPGRGQVWLELRPQQDDAGNVAWVEAPLVRVPYTDYLEGPANSWGSTPWVARADLYTLDDLEAMFPSVDATKVPRDFALPMPEGKGSKEWNEANGGKEQFKRARVWEIWAKFPARRRIYVAEGFDTVLRVDADPFRLKNFFPCPRPIIANADESWQVPLTDYSRYEDQAMEIDRLSARIYVQTEVLKRRGCYDKRFPDLAGLPDADDNHLIPVENFTELMQSGGLSSAVQWEDLTPTVTMLGELHRQRSELIQLVYQLTGISDLARGMTDPNETLGAQKLKMSFGSGRFSARQTESRRFAADAYALKAELIAEHFPKAQLEEMSGMVLPAQAEIDAARNEMQAIHARFQAAAQAGFRLPPPPRAEMLKRQRTAAARFSWEDISAVLQSDYRRCYRVGIETDQTQFRDEAEDKASRIEFMQTVMATLKELTPSIQQNPANGELAKELVMFTVRGFRGGRALEESIETAIDRMIQQAMQRQQAGPQPDPVTASKVKLNEAQAQKFLVDAQVDAQQLHPGASHDLIAAQGKMMDNQAKAIGHQIDLTAKAENLQFERAQRATANEVILRDDAAGLPLIPQRVQ